MSKKVKEIKKRLEYLRGELRAERISLAEIAELQSLADEIPNDDLELREAAGLKENPGRIVIVIEGGLVQSVYSSNESDEVEIIDLDQTDSLKQRNADEKRVAKLDQDKTLHAHI